ncbi:MAG: hypothetical protein WCC06_00640 [Candidatus Aminicenantales bacterium]
MHTLRKIIGWLIVIILGLPLLFGIIWAVGLIKATVSPEFVSDLPREIISDVPRMMDDFFQAAQDEATITDPNTRLWLQAVSKTGLSPTELMEKTGLLSWMQDELSNSLKEIGQVLRGERKPQSIVINLRPLKNALLHPEVDRFLEETLRNLPPCDEEGQKQWQEFAAGYSHKDELPACRPDLEMAKDVLRNERMKAVHDIEDEIEVFENVHAFRFFPFSVARTITFFSYFLFLIPAAFIFLGVLIASSSPSSFFRWSGVSIFAGGLPALLLALASKYFSLWALKFTPMTWHEGWATELHELAFYKLRWIPIRIVDALFTPVIAVAGVVCLLGIVLFAISFSVRNGRKPEKKLTSGSSSTTPGVEPPSAARPPEAKEIKTGQNPEDSQKS